MKASEVGPKDTAQPASVKGWESGLKAGLPGLESGRTGGPGLGSGVHANVGAGPGGERSKEGRRQTQRRGSKGH